VHARGTLPVTKEKDRSLTQEVHDTPVKPLTALDERLARYGADLDSIPPPPLELEEKRDSLVVRARDRWKSGSYDLEALLGEQKAFFERALAVRIGEERLAHEHERTLQAERERDRLQKQIDRKREWWSDLLKQSLAPAIATAIIAVCALIWALSKK
jgi:hypothetical protein